MRIRVPLLAAVAMAGFLGSVAHADLIVSSQRVANANLSGYDSVFIYVVNDGLGLEAAGSMGIASAFLTITDETQAGLVMGLYRSGGTLTSQTSNALARANGDPTGAQMGNNKTFAVNLGTIPAYGGQVYPADLSETGFQLYSWIGNGGLNSNYNAVANESANGSAVGIAPEGISTTTVAANPYGVLLSSFHSEGLFAGNIDGSTQNGGLVNGLGALIGVAVVKSGDTVGYAGLVGCDVIGTAAVPFSGVNGVPEPASLGVLALGGLALLARRRK
jgi:hypothetical protein